MTGTILFFGLGYSARVLAARLHAQGWTIRGTSRDPAKLGGSGYEMHAFHRRHPLPAAAFAGVTHVLSSIAPDELGDPALELHAPDLPGVSWAGYLSTTAVYGDRAGEWVDETAELRPEQPRAVRRAAAEAAWLASGLPAQVFRLAGIYGPGRSQLDSVRAGTARRIVKPGQVFSRIHVEDIANVLEASIARPNPGAIYNVCDDEPAPPQDAVGFAAELLGVAAPPAIPFEEAELSPMARSFYADNRRVSNERIKRELGVRLDYPTYREGLRALAAS